MTDWTMHQDEDWSEEQRGAVETACAALHYHGAGSTHLVAWDEQHRPLAVIALAHIDAVGLDVAVVVQLDQDPPDVLWGSRDPYADPHADRSMDHLRQVGEEMMEAEEAEAQPCPRCGSSERPGHAECVQHVPGMRD